jgi:hypothetical protein
MVYNTQNHWDFGLCLWPAILETRKHNVSETGSVSILRREGWETPTLLGVFPPHLRTETDSVSETLFSSF